MENIRGYRDDMLLFHAIIKKNINFLRRSSKKDDFIIENILEGVNIIDDIRIIELYFERNEQAIKETDIKYGKLCHKLSYNVLNNRQDSEECVNTTYRRSCRRELQQSSLLHRWQLLCRPQIPF